jgi:hypothetical protein
MEIYFPSFLCKFSREEVVVGAGGGVRCTTSNGTCSYNHQRRHHNIHPHLHLCISANKLRRFLTIPVEVHHRHVTLRPKRIFILSIFSSVSGFLIYGALISITQPSQCISIPKVKSTHHYLQHPVISLHVPPPTTKKGPSYSMLSTTLPPQPRRVSFRCARSLGDLIEKYLEPHGNGCYGEP